MDRVVSRRLAGLVAIGLFAASSAARADALSSGTSSPIDTTPVAPSLAETSQLLSLTGNPYYYTYGSIGFDTSSDVYAGYVPNPGSIAFYGGYSGTLLAPGAFSLGAFVTQPLPDAASVTYTNVPFYVHMVVNPNNPSDPSSQTNILIQGALNGTLSSNDKSSVLATISSVSVDSALSYGSAPLPFSTADLLFDVPQLLAPSGINLGVTNLIGRFEFGFPQTVPEPTTLAAFGALAAWAGLRRRRKMAASA